MSGFKGVMKDGWHPKGRDGKKESWRNDFKGINQVAGWMGKGKDPNDDRSEHVSQPMSSLKDPAAWGPPPKHINYHGPSALPNENTPDRRGLGAPLSQNQVHQQNARLEQEQQAEMAAEEEQAQKPAPPPVPYRVNTTGLATNHLPPPPRRLDSPADAGPPVSSRPRPSVPPRVPPRTNPTPPSHTPSPPPAYAPIQPTEYSDGSLNQGAISRLNRAGVSVPALGIGNGRGNSHGTGSPTTAGSAGQNPVNELQSRFSQMKTTSSPSPGPPPPPRRATNFSESSPVSRSPAPAPPPHTTRSTSSVETDVLSSIGRKKPPPPPPKKYGMRASPVNTSSPSDPSPPPVPLATKPR